MSIEEFFGRFDNCFHGDVSVALHSDEIQTGIITVFKNPRLKRTKFGIVIEGSNGSAEIDYRLASDVKCIAGDDLSFKYKDAGLVMSVAFMAQLKLGF